MQPLTQPGMTELQGLLGYPTQSPHLTTLLGVKSCSWLASQLQIPSLPSLFPLLIACSSPCHWCRFRLPTHSKPNAETMRFAAKKKKKIFFFSRQSSKETGGQVSTPSPQRQRDRAIYRLRNKASGQSKAWGAWGKVIGKRCRN